MAQLRNLFLGGFLGILAMVVALKTKMVWRGRTDPKRKIRILFLFALFTNLSILYSDNCNLALKELNQLTDSTCWP
jgi:hypothetical protein